MKSALNLTQFCILKKDSQRAKFSFHLNGYSNVQSYCMSRKFWFAGNYWKLQICKKNNNFGMYLRWYGVQPEHSQDENNEDKKLDFWCKTSVLFSLVNIIYRHSSVTEGKRDEKEVFETVSHGIGYSKILSLEELENTPGYIIDDKIYLQLQIRVYETGYKDVLWCSPTSKRGTSEGINFPFYGTEWKLVFFPHGEDINFENSKIISDKDDDENSKSEAKEEDKNNKTTDNNDDDDGKDIEENPEDVEENAEDIRDIENEVEIDSSGEDNNRSKSVDENADENEVDKSSDNLKDGHGEIDENESEKDYEKTGNEGANNNNVVEESEGNEGGDDNDVRNENGDDVCDNDGDNKNINDGDDEDDKSSDVNDEYDNDEKDVKEGVDDENENDGDSMQNDRRSDNSDDNKNDSDNESNGVKDLKMSSIYLMRCGDNADVELRYNVIFRLSVDDEKYNKSIVLNKHFYHKITNAYGIASFLDMSTVDSHQRIEVTVAFEDVVPYYYFGLALNDLDENGASSNKTFVSDQFHYPWSFCLHPEDDKILGCLSLDPNKESHEIKSLIKRNKCLQVCWVAEVLSPTNIENSVLFTTRSRRKIKDVVFSSNRKHDVLEFPVGLKKFRENEGDNPLVDETGLLSIRLSIYCSNYVISEHGQLLLSFHSMEQIVEEIRRTPYSLQAPPLPATSPKVVGNEQEERIKDIEPSSIVEEDSAMIKSLVDHLDSYDRYIKDLEKNPKKAKAIHGYISVTSLIQNCRPSDNEHKQFSLVARSLEKVLHTLPLDIEKILNVGALGQGTVVANDLSLDLVVFLNDYAEQKHRFKIILRVMKERIKERSSKDTTDRRLYRFKKEKRLPYVSNFYHTTNGLIFKLGHVNTVIVLSQGFQNFTSHHDIYEKAVKTNKDEMHQYVVMTSYLQLAFVSKQSHKCKDLICVVKSWSNDVLWESVDMRPSSYLLTLIVIHAFEKLVKMNVARTPSFGKEVLMKFGELILDSKLRIEWNMYYDPSNHSHASSEKKRPFIRDPAIPFHNVADTGITDWTQFRRETKSWIGSLTF